MAPKEAVIPTAQPTGKPTITAHAKTLIQKYHQATTSMTGTKCPTHHDGADQHCHQTKQTHHSRCQPSCHHWKMNGKRNNRKQGRGRMAWDTYTTQAYLSCPHASMKCLAGTLKQPNTHGSKHKQDNGAEGSSHTNCTTYRQTHHRSTCKDTHPKITTSYHDHDGDQVSHSSQRSVLTLSSSRHHQRMTSKRLNRRRGRGGMV